MAMKCVSLFFSFKPSCAEGCFPSLSFDKGLLENEKKMGSCFFFFKFRHRPCTNPDVFSSPPHDHRLRGVLWLRGELRVLPRPTIVPGSDTSRPGLRALLWPRWHPIRGHRPAPPAPPPPAPPPCGPTLSRGGAVLLRLGVPPPPPPPRGLAQPRARGSGLHAQHLQRDVWPRHALHHGVPQ